MVVTLSVFHPASQAGFADWAASLAESAADTEGCLGTDISTVTDGIFEPAVAATFVDPEACDRWIDSTRRAEILRRGRDLGWLPSAPTLELVDGEAPPPGVGAFRHEILPGKADEFLRAQRELTGAASEFSGYEGTSLFIDDAAGSALSVLRFRTDRQLSAWVSSRERGDALDILRSSLTHDFEAVSATTAFGTTVRTDNGRFRQTPNWKSAMMVLLVLYPTVMILSRFLGPVLDRIGAQPWLALWLSQVVSIGLMQWWLMPWAAKPFHRWLDPVDGNGLRSNLAGAVTILLLYIVCLAIFANVTWLQFWDYVDG
ncbi:antibiotic biosynthesis monooxygenase [Gordonia metallireducens]|uniref:antibiotic biosynthesis monooxygenase n=1 Tax=Gordonia metallireducens TaxID=2897779 RepID=UPI001E2BA182|nr:antibiotic biosynthesis monooxygenase [Gordonia metallireducens]